MQRRFAADPQFQATLLLLQERIPRTGGVLAPAQQFPEIRVGGDVATPVARVVTTPASAMPDTQLLSNGRYHVMVTGAGGGSSRWKDLAVTRWREDPTRDHYGTFCYVQDVDTGAYLVGRAPADARAGGTLRSDLLGRPRRVPPPRPRPRAAHRDRGVSRGRRRAAAHAHRQPLAHAARRGADELRRDRPRDRVASDTSHPAFSNLFVETEVLADERAILATRRPRSPGEHAPWMLHVMAVHEAASRPRIVRDGPRGVHRTRPLACGAGRAASAPARSPAVRAPCSIPIAAIRVRIALEPQQAAVVDLVFGIADTRDAALGLVHKYEDRTARGPRTGARVDARAGRPAPDQCHRRRRAPVCAARRLDPVRESVAARRSGDDRAQPPRAIGTVGLRDLGRPADRAAAHRRRREHRPRAPARPGPRLLAPEGPGRGPRHLERGPGRLSPGAAGPGDGADLGARRGADDGSARRHLRAPRRPDLRRGPRAARVGGPHRVERRERHAGRAGGRPRARRSARAAARARRASRASRMRRAARTRCAADPGQWTGRLHARRPRVRHHDGRHAAHARAVGRTCSRIASSAAWCRKAAARTRGASMRTSSG